jgi:hypothetical protein
MPPIDEIKMTKFGPSLLGINFKPATDIYPIYLFTAL